MMRTIVAAIVFGAAAVAAASDQSAGWRAPRPQDVERQVFAWLDAGRADAAARAKIAGLWSGLPADASEDELMMRLARTYALLDPRAARLAARCSEPRSQLVLPREAWLREGDAPPLLAANMRLLYARWLVGESLFDEAQEQLDGLTPSDVAAPAALLFCQSVVAHALLNKQSGLKSIDDLLQGAEASPRRYVALAKLMREDLKGLKDDTLDHVARRMDDVRRRLELGRAGPKVRQVEDGVIESLDKMIKKLEEQQQRQQSASEAGGSRSSKPMPDSRPAGGRGPGEVTKKNLGPRGGEWGNLPAKQREEALQQIGRELPAHYRDAIEQYFRRLAAEENE